MKVFLGGTCKESGWRDELAPLLDKYGIEYFDPIVEGWNDECIKEENRQKATSDIRLYVVTPKMIWTYTIAEAVDDSNKCPEKTLFVILEKDDKLGFNEGEMRSLMAACNMVRSNGAMAKVYLGHNPWASVLAKYLKEILNEQGEEKMVNVNVIKLGDEVRDNVSGFTGITISRHSYLQGCDRFGVQPPVDKDGKLPEVMTFDGPSLECITASKVKRQATFDDPGGPDKYQDTRRY